MIPNEAEFIAALRKVTNAFGRLRQVGSAEPLELFIASPEVTILAKLDWYCKGGGVSNSQWRDVLGVLKVQAGALDRAYLRDWAARLKLNDLLRRALDDAGLPPEP